MTRSVWKGPFVDGYLLEEGGRRAGFGPQGRDQDLVAPLDDHAPVRGPDLRRAQRPEARARAGPEDMVGMKLGEFAPTRYFPGHAADKKAKRK